jgi:hypothetical protein
MRPNAARLVTISAAACFAQTAHRCLNAAQRVAPQVEVEGKV